MIKVDKTTLEQYRGKIVEFIKKYTFNSGHKTGVVGLSGGVDSSLTYSLTCEALGEKNTIGVIMPYKSSKKSFNTLIPIAEASITICLNNVRDILPVERVINWRGHITQFRLHLFVGSI